MADRSILTAAQQATFFNDVTRELADALHVLHQNNLLHLDLKPSNILLRSVHPLDLVLIDFGIATALDADMSKKFTQVRGTPMYQSPESYSGGMGRPADWWGLGMILLEIAMGVHPFRGLSERVIKYAIATEPVEIPDNLDVGQKELLRGLLTRDPEKRWGYEQVARWLSGERGISQHFETVSETQKHPGKGTLTPVTFMGEQYYSLADLAAAFLKAEQSWEKGKGFLMRGYVKQWLEKNEAFDAIMDMDEVLSGAEDPDEKLFCFVQRFGKDLPFVFGGHLITIENLLIFAGKVLKLEPMTAMEQKITDSIADGSLLPCIEFYKQQGRTSEKLSDLEIILKSLKGKESEYIVNFLDFYTHIKNYYCPFLNGNTTVQNIIKEFSLLSCMPMTVEHWNQISNRYILPSDIFKQMQFAQSYNQALSRLDDIEKNNLLILRGQYTDEEVKKIQYYLNIKNLSGDFIDFCLHPEKYYCPFLNGNTDISNIAENISILQCVPITTERWNQINAQYILPLDIIDQMQSASSYNQVMFRLNEIEQNNLFITRDKYTNEEEKKIQYLLSHIDINNWSEEFLYFCLHPEKYYCPFLYFDTTIENIAEKASKLKCVPITIERYNQIKATYIIPNDIFNDMSSPESYSKAISNLDKLEQNGNLVKRYEDKVDDTKNKSTIKKYEEKIKFKYIFIYLIIYVLVVVLCFAIFGGYGILISVVIQTIIMKKLFHYDIVISIIISLILFACFLILLEIVANHY